MSLTLWLFPESDFEAWRSFTGHTSVNSYEEYRVMIEKTIAGVKPGTEVRVIAPMVLEFMNEMKRRGYYNTPYNRRMLIDDWPE